MDELCGVRLGQVHAVYTVALLDTLRRPLRALTAPWNDVGSVNHDVTDLLLAVAGQVGQALERTLLYDAEQRVRCQLAASVEALTDLARKL